MGSIISGFEYDIFISYRQKDNKYDGWVTEFVNNLKKELEATFKEDISLYFDINPHDGLLETHDVDASLKDKLKCLIFIPIISRTYCDPKSFAWEHEFKAFIDQASHDQFGLKVKLPNGNVATRILPIQIHDLYPEDKALLEKELGGVLRAIEFIYKEQGVNRPLADRDNEDKNTNKTNYRNQINKVANAIDEVIHGLKGKEPAVTDRKVSAEKPDFAKESDESKSSPVVAAKKSKKWLIIALSALLCVVGVFAIYKVIISGKQAESFSKQDKTIAVLPFVNDSPDKDNEYFCNGMMDEILTQLQNIHDLKVKSRTSVEKYRDTEMDIKDIGRELGVFMIMEGSVRRIADDLRISVQLINAKTGDHLWAENYDGKYTTEIFDFQSNLAKKVATSVNAVITPQEEKRIDAIPTTQMLAHDLSLKASQMMSDYIFSNDSLDLRLSLNLVNQALKIDPEYIYALRIKGEIFAHSGNYDSAWYYFDKILEIDPENAAGYKGKGLVYFYKRTKPDSALLYSLKADKLAPDDFWSYLIIGQIYCMQKNDIIKGLPYYHKSIVSGGGSMGMINQSIANAYLSVDYYNKAEKYTRNAISAKAKLPFIKAYGSILLIQGKYNECFQFLDSISSITRFGPACDMVRFRIYITQKEFEKAEKYYNLSVTNGYSPTIDDRLYLAYLYNETFRKKEASTILYSNINFCEKLIAIYDSWTISYFNTHLAAAYAMLNEDFKALKCLSEVLRTGPCEGDIKIESFPGFDKLRSKPEFQSILNRIEDKKASLREQVKQMELRGEINL